MEGVDRLRERFDGEVRSWRMTSEAFAEIDSMLRDIEREHEMALKADTESTNYDLGYMAGRAAAMREHDDLKKAVKEREEVELFGVGYMALPVDADGLPIHLGDTMCGTCPSGKYVCGEVSAIGDNKIWLWNVQFSLCPDYMHHYHAPTVEDVLFEFARFWSDEELTDIEHLQPHAAQAIAEYAAKLRLAE